jgi:hypothetical protein
MTRRQQVMHAMGIGFAAFSVGALDSLIKGQGLGILGALSETVVPWFLLAFLAGAYTKERRFALGAIAGFEATMFALVGFYFVNSLLFNFGAATWISDFHSSLLSGKVYFELGVVSGPLMGALGVWWKQKLSVIPVVAIGAAFLLEALARSMEANNFFQYGHQVGAIECFVGVLWIVLAGYVTTLLRRKIGQRGARTRGEEVLQP